jgi:hypothetical protein
MSANPWYLNVFNDLTWFVGIVNIFSWSHDSNVEILCPENPLESSNGLPRNNSNMKCGKKTVSFASCHCLITKHLIDNGFVWKYGNHQIRRLIIFFPIKKCVLFIDVPHSQTHPCNALCFMNIKANIPMGNGDASAVVIVDKLRPP